MRGIRILQPSLRKVSKPNNQLMEAMWNYVKSTPPFKFLIESTITDLEPWLQIRKLQLIHSPCLSNSSLGDRYPFNVFDDVES